MAKQSNNQKITKLKVSTIANFEGAFAAILGLGVAILWSLSTTIDMASSTGSVLGGLAFGLATGIVSILVLPFIYFAIGWVLGLIHGWVFNVVLGASGGIGFTLENDNE